MPQSDPMKTKLFVLLFALCVLCHVTYAESATWLANPADNNWNNPTNWSTGVVPGFFDNATFDVSSIRDVSVTQAGSGINDLIFDATAEAFTVTVQPGGILNVFGSLVNNSGVEQNFVTNPDEGDRAGILVFSDSSIAMTGPITFTQQASHTRTGSSGSLQFNSAASAGNATIHNVGASVAGAVGGEVLFDVAATSAANSTIINDGATAPGATGGVCKFFLETPTAGNANLIANGGSNGGGGGVFTFENLSDGGTARVELFGNGYLDISGHGRPTVTIGSLEGDGIVYLGRNTLAVGGNALSTSFAGQILPGDPNGGLGTGDLIKTTSATLTLSGANRYTGGTTVSDGTLVVSNTNGSGTGKGAVLVNAGTLGGSGIISGAVTIGTGSGSGSFLAPAHGGNEQLTLTIRGSLTFNSDSAYTCTLKGKDNRSKIDKVIANGVTINRGATFGLSFTTQGTLTQGIVLTVIRNTAATPISGDLQQPARRRDRQRERLQLPSQLQRRRRERSHPHGSALAVAFSLT